MQDVMAHQNGRDGPRSGELGGRETDMYICGLPMSLERIGRLLVYLTWVLDMAGIMDDRRM